jgi:hypothetical protein
MVPAIPNCPRHLHRKDDAQLQGTGARAPLVTGNKSFQVPRRSARLPGWREVSRPCLPSCASPRGSGSGSRLATGISGIFSSAGRGRGHTRLLNAHVHSPASGTRRMFQARRHEACACAQFRDRMYAFQIPRVAARASRAHPRSRPPAWDHGLHAHREVRNRTQAARVAE